ncbi:hypothetical protein ABEB36_010415 [Hypothenemus hampei]|uniref:Uncharacterized protein n=1 Tax=Hypothenemus hampei TaxID=57062 RepID=A0ABD1EJL6_HYPHA
MKFEFNLRNELHSTPPASLDVIGKINRENPFQPHTKIFSLETPSLLSRPMVRLFVSSTTANSRAANDGERRPTKRAKAVHNAKRAIIENSPTSQRLKRASRGSGVL